jgi:hypothetical protein
MSAEIGPFQSVPRVWPRRDAGPSAWRMSCCGSIQESPAPSRLTPYTMTGMREKSVSSIHDVVNG